MTARPGSVSSRPAVPLVTWVAAGVPLVFQALVAVQPLAALQGVPAELDDRSPLQGIVLGESSFEPIASATVAIVGTELRTSTDGYGAFAFADPPTGRVSVRITAPDHISMVEEVEVREGSIVYVQFLLPRIDAVLADLFVGGSRAGSSGEPATAADLVARQVPGLLFPPEMVGDNQRGIRLRGVSSFSQQGDPQLYVDGVRVSPSVPIYDALSQIPAGNVERIEILRGPSAAFQHAYAADGAIHVFTRGRSGASPD